MKIRNVFASEFASAETTAAERGKRFLQADIFTSDRRARNWPIVPEDRTNFRIGPKSPALAACKATKSSVPIFLQIQ